MLSRIHWLSLATALLMLAGFSSPGISQEPPDETIVEAMRDRFEKSAGEFEFTVASTGEKLQLLNRAVSKWSNPERKTHAGALFVWTLKGRPEMLMCTYPTDNVGNYEHEFQSLSVESISGARQGSVFWEPGSEAVQWQPIPANIPVGKTPAIRLVQMRRIASLYTAKLVFTKQPDQMLHVQTTPLHRYDADQLPETVVDGALFAYVQGTDPEVVAMVEARKNAAGEETWHIAFARMTVVSAKVEYQSATVWEVEWGQRGFFSHYNVLKNSD
jgi:hypothetical protein